jgi:hypothetical protein
VNYVDATDLAILGDDEVPFNFETNETSEQNEVSQADVDIHFFSTINRKS